MTAPKVDLGLTNSVNRDFADKLLDFISSKDSGGLSDGSTNDSTNITNAVADLVAAYSAGVLILPVNTVYTEGSLTMNSDVVILDQSQPGLLRVLTKDEGSTLPITKGGLEIKSLGVDSVFLRSHNSGVSGNPYLQILNTSTGQRAGLDLLFVALNQYMDVTEMTTPAAPAANTGRLFCQDNGAGKTQLCVKFNTGAVQVIATQP